MPQDEPLYLLYDFNMPHASENCIYPNYIHIMRQGHISFCFYYFKHILDHVTLSGFIGDIDKYLEANITGYWQYNLPWLKVIRIISIKLLHD